MKSVTRYLLPALLLSLTIGTMIAGAIAIMPNAPLYVNPSVTTVVPFTVSLNTVGGKGYYAVISLSAQTGLTASANVTAYPSTGTSTSNVTIPIGISVSATTPGVYQLNVTITEYNSSTAPQSVLAVQKYVTYVHVISPSQPAPIIIQSTTNSLSESLTLTAPSNTSWYITYKVLYPNSTIAPAFYGPFQSSSLTPQVTVTVMPSMTMGTGNATITFTINETNNLRFGEIPVTVIVYQYIKGTNALYSTHVIHVNFFSIPAGVKGILAQRFPNITVVGHLKFGNISIGQSNIPAEILGIETSSHSISILFNDSFTGMVSFYSNETPTEVIADGHVLQEYYMIPQGLPLGGWTYYDGQVYVYADPSNVTVVYSNTTTTTTSSTTLTTSSGSTTGSTSTTTSSTSGTLSSLKTFYEEHKDLIIITIVFLLIITVVFFLVRK